MKRRSCLLPPPRSPIHAPFVDPNGDGASYAAALVDALRKQTRPEPSPPRSPTRRTASSAGSARTCEGPRHRDADRQPLHDDLGAPRAEGAPLRGPAPPHVRRRRSGDHARARALHRRQRSPTRRACSATSSTATPATCAVARAASRPRSIFTAGEHHDLREIFDELNARYFDQQIDAAITWGPRCGRPAPPQLDQDGQLLRRGSADPHPPLARSRASCRASSSRGSCSTRCCTRSTTSASRTAAASSTPRSSSPTRRCSSTTTRRRAGSAATSTRC